MFNWLALCCVEIHVVLLIYNMGQGFQCNLSLTFIML